jgi:hypothetical protein
MATAMPEIQLCCSPKEVCEVCYLQREVAWALKNDEPQNDTRKRRVKFASMEILTV